MNAGEHYREAERLLQVAENEMTDYAATSDPVREAQHLKHATFAQQRAQVHADLARAAVAALPLNLNDFGRQS